MKGLRRPWAALRAALWRRGALAAALLTLAACSGEPSPDDLPPALPAERPDAAGLVGDLSFGAGYRYDEPGAAQARTVGPATLVLDDGTRFEVPPGTPTSGYCSAFAGVAATPGDAPLPGVDPCYAQVYGTTTEVDGLALLMVAPDGMTAVTPGPLRQRTSEGVVAGDGVFVPVEGEVRVVDCLPDAPADLDGFVGSDEVGVVLEVDIGTGRLAAVRCQYGD